jgi:hypothetical protein
MQGGLYCRKKPIGSIGGKGHEKEPSRKNVKEERRRE